MIELNQEFIESVKENYPISKDKIIAAYKFAFEAHKGLVRKSGEPYIIHPVSVAQILIDNNMDYPTIIAGLLHDVVEDTMVTKEEIEKMFGETVAKLVEGMTKIDNITVETKKLTEADSIKKLLLAMAEDIRIIFIKLADRLHNMRTIEFLSRERQLKNAKETQELFIPIAERIGVRKLRSELQSLTFKCLYPDDYAKIKAELDDKLKDHEQDLELLEKEIKMILLHNRVQAKIVGLPQNYYSIYKKMQGQGINKIYGLKSFKIIVQTELDCYKVLGLMHRAYMPIPSQIKDYIATPKINGYQSLNTALISKGNDITFNVMIRTEQMDKNSEFGVSSLWRNKDNDKKYEDKFEKHNDLKKIIMGEDGWESSSDDFINAIKTDLMPYMTWVFTPEHKPVRINVKNPTAIDFAYIVHSDIGNSAVSAIINGKEMPLKTELKNGDEVKILVSKTKKYPSRNWLIYARTPYARKKIREFIKKNIVNKHIVNGKELLESELSKIGHSLADIIANFAEIQREMNYLSLDDIYASCSYDSDSLLQIIEFILNKKQQLLAVKQSPVLVENVSDIVKIDMAKCCGPVYGDDIVGILSKNGVVVHCKHCQNLSSIITSNIVNTKWRENIKCMLETGLKIIFSDGVGVIAKIFDVFADLKIDISKVVAKRTNNNEAEIELLFKTENIRQLEKVISKLKKLKFMKEIKRISAS